MAGIVQTASDVRGSQRPLAIGDWAAHSDSDRWATAFNQSPQAVQITTTTVSDPGDSVNITITINGYDVVTSTGTGNDATQIAALMVLAINADPRVRGDVIATSASDVLTLTGLTPGLAFTCTESSASLTTPSDTQAAAAAAAIPVGRGCITAGYSTTEAEERCALAKSSLLTAQVITFTCTYVASAIVKASIYEIRGSERVHLGSGIFVSATDLNATLDGLAAAINTALAANTVLAASTPATATEITLTAEVVGLEFEVDLEHVSGGASSPVFTKTATTGPSRSTSIARALVGVSMRPKDDEVPTVGSEEPEWPGNAGVRLAKQGQLVVESAQTIVSGDTAYIELGVTADNGQFFNTGSATRLALPKALAQFERDGSVTADTAAVLRLNIS